MQTLVKNICFLLLWKRKRKQIKVEVQLVPLPAAYLTSVGGVDTMAVRLSEPFRSPSQPCLSAGFPGGGPSDHHPKQPERGCQSFCYTDPLMGGGVFILTQPTGAVAAATWRRRTTVPPPCSPAVLHAHSSTVPERIYLWQHETAHLNFNQAEFSHIPLFHRLSVFL